MTIISSSSAQSKIHGLYAITDPSLIPSAHLFSAVQYAILGGASIIQYRNKQATKTTQLHEAQQLRQLCKQHHVCFIINDDPQLAKQVAADGVHVGKEDGKIADARKQLGPSAIIGVSCYNQLKNAQQAISQGADYVAFGRFYPSQTKPLAIQADISLLTLAKKTLNVPIVAIGGINRDNAENLIQNGADSVAVIHDLFHNNQEIYHTAKQYQNLFL